MKAKITLRNTLFLMLGMLMLCSVMSMSSFAASECSHPNLLDDNWEIVTAANCNKTGQRKQYCFDCKDWIKETIPVDKDAHSPGNWYTVKEHTCKQEGIEARDCIICGASEIDTRDVPAHDYSVLYTVKPTCTTAGYEVKACLTCYDLHTDTIDPSDKEEAHNYGDYQVIEVATCTGGLERRVCKRCNKVDEKSEPDPDNHTGLDWESSAVKKVAPTCETPGYRKVECTACKQVVREELACHSESSFMLISSVPSTCETHGYELRKCVCNMEYKFELELDEENHVYRDWQITKEASCVAGERVRRCKYHYNAKQTETIPAVTDKHNYGEWTTVREADCSLKGLEERVCLDCNKAKESRVTPEKHHLNDWETKVKMSCDESKLTTGVKLAKCSNCSYEKYYDVPALHDYNPWRIIKLADCKNGNEGIKERSCKVCGKIESVTYVEEHDFTDWYVTIKPACSVGEKLGMEGRVTRWCNKCQLVEHKSVPAKHEYVDVEIVKYPVCATLVADRVIGEKITECIYCGDRKSEDIEPEHTYGEWVTQTEPSYNKDTKQHVTGLKKRICVVCEDVQTATIPIAHNYGRWVDYKGNKLVCGKTYNHEELVRSCTDCGVVEKGSGQANHINAVTVTIEATCMQSGYTEIFCPDCNTSQYKDIVPAFGHELDLTWSSEAYPTCTERGSRYKACANCDYLEYEYIDKLEHRLLQLEPGVEPTCTESGRTGKAFCINCKEEFSSYEIPALGHEYDEGGEVCKRCNGYKGSEKGCHCACHSTTGLERILFSLVNKLYQMLGINQQCSCGVLHYEEVGFLAKLFGKGEETTVTTK